MPASALAPTTTLRALVAQSRPRRARDGYPDDVRRRVVRHARPLHVAGRSLATLARDVGLPAPTLRRWRDSDASGGFVPVIVSDPAPALRAEDAAAMRALSLVTPGGFRVDGLDLAALRALLPELR